MAFNKLPIELNKEIASYIDNDQNLCNFRLVCHNTNNAINGDNYSFWRKRFHEHFDPIGGPVWSNVEYRKRYQDRRKYLKRGAIFASGNNRSESNCLKILRDLIVEADPTLYEADEHGLPTSKNLVAVQRFCKSTNIATDIFRPYKKSTRLNPLLVAIQLMCHHWCINPHFGTEILQFPTSQTIAYQSAVKEPIFLGSEKLAVNLHYVLHVMNFFRYHMVREEELTLQGPFELLGALEKPHVWDRKLIDGSYPVGMHWKGTYSYLDRNEIHAVRHRQDDGDVYPDHNVDQPDRAIQTLRLEFPTKQVPVWPQLFEKYLQSLPKPTTTKTNAQHRSKGSPIGDSKSFCFIGDGYDDEDFYSAGWLNPLPPQQGIPGFQRMTMMKFFYDSLGKPDEEALWAYEGVVLPGGQIMVGRWWSPDDTALTSKDMYCGPFIFWNVDRSVLGVPMAAEDSLNFDSKVSASDVLGRASGCEPELMAKGI